MTEQGLKRIAERVRWHLNNRQLASALAELRALYDAGKADALAAPLPELKDSHPLILYFETAQDKDAFVKLVRQVHPEFTEREVG